MGRFVEGGLGEGGVEVEGFGKGGVGGGSSG